MYNLTNIIIVYAAFIIIDLAYLSTNFAKSNVNTQILAVQKENLNMTPTKQFASLFIWGFLLLGIHIFVKPLSQDNTSALLYGALYGLIVYLIFDLTNYVIFSNYTFKFLVLDVAWGVFLCSIINLLYFKLN